MSKSVTPTTKKGKPCKLCLKSGLCHLHGGRGATPKTPRKQSKYWKDLYKQEKADYVKNWRAEHLPDVWFTPLQKDIPFTSFENWLKEKENIPSPEKPSSSSKKSFSSPKHYPSIVTFSDLDDALGTFGSPKKTLKEFEHFKNLPPLAIAKILLNVPDLNQLVYICNNSKEAAFVCKQPEFRRKYHKKYPLFLKGQVDIRNIQVREQRDWELNLLLMGDQDRYVLIRGYDDWNRSGVFVIKWLGFRSEKFPMLRGYEDAVDEKYYTEVNLKARDPFSLAVISQSITAIKKSGEFRFSSYEVKK